MSITHQTIKDLGQYVLLSSEVCSELAEENQRLHQEKQALEKQAEQGNKGIALVKERDLERTLDVMQSAGLIKTSNRKEVREDFYNNPVVLLKLVEKVAESQIVDSSFKLGNVDDSKQKVAATSSEDRESDRVFNELFSN